MPLSPQLRAAYAAARYAAFTEPVLVFRIGEHSAGIDALMEKSRTATAAFVTACNPYGLPADEETNSMACGELTGLTDRPDWHCVPGEGTDLREEWPREPSLLIVGITRADAQALGRRFNQRAIVFIEWGQAPELVELD